MANSSDIFVQTLINWDVSVVFGRPGKSINGIVEALQRRADEIDFVPVSHEASAAFMATGYAKWTGQLGVCIAASRASSVNLLAALYEAKRERLPILAVNGLHPNDHLETSSTEEDELALLFANIITHSGDVKHLDHLEETVDHACRSALAYKSIAHLSVTGVAQEQTASEDYQLERNGKHLRAFLQSSSPIPDDNELMAAAEILNNATRVAVLAGERATGACQQLNEISELLAAPIIQTLANEAGNHRNSDITFDGIGKVSLRQFLQIMKHCDAILVVDTNARLERYRNISMPRAVQIDAGPQQTGSSSPADIRLVGDAQDVLTRLLPYLAPKQDRSFLKRIQSRVLESKEHLDKLGNISSHPLRFEQVLAAFGSRIALNGVLVTDSLQSTELTAHHVSISENDIRSVFYGFATVTPAVPYLMAAGMAFPGRQLYGVVGDIGMSLQLADLATIVGYYFPLKLLVTRDALVNQVANKQFILNGNAHSACEYPPMDFAQIAIAMGAKGHTISTYEEIDPVLDKAFAEDGPVLIQAIATASEREEALFDQNLRSEI